MKSITQIIGWVGSVEKTTKLKSGQTVKEISVSFKNQKNQTFWAQVNFWGETKAKWIENLKLDAGDYITCIGEIESISCSEKGKVRFKIAGNFLYVMQKKIIEKEGLE